VSVSPSTRRKTPSWRFYNISIHSSTNCLPNPSSIACCTLPLELRYTVCEHHFLHSTKSTSTAYWPTLHVMASFGQKPWGETTGAQFLPSLCMINKGLRHELITCLSDLKEVHFWNTVAFEQFAALCQITKFKLFDFAAKLRKATFQTSTKRTAASYTSGRPQGQSRRFKGRRRWIPPSANHSRRILIFATSTLRFTRHYSSLHDSNPKLGLQVNIWRDLMLSQLLDSKDSGQLPSTLQAATVTGASIETFAYAGSSPSPLPLIRPASDPTFPLYRA
jgi:hypothetical protein